MLKPGDRLYFIHIPKTAGTTLIPLLDARFHTDEVCPAKLWRELVTLPQEQLPRYRLFRGHFGGKGFDAFLPEPPRRLTMLRHPVPLALSNYQFILREPGTHLHRLVKSHKMSFADFLQHPKTRPAITNNQVRDLSSELRYRRGTGPILSDARATTEWLRKHLVYPRNEERLEQALAVLRECAFFGLVERFDESMALLAWTFGWPPVRQVQKLRLAPRPPRQNDEVPEDLAARVRAYNPFDLELYRMGETIFSERLAAMLNDLKRYAEPGEAVPDSFANHPELVHKLLDRHYRERRPDPTATHTNGTRITFAEPLQGSGWHDREIAPGDGAVYRWTGPDRTSTIDVLVEATEDLVITFLVIDAASRDLLDGVQLAVENHPVALRRIGRWTVVPLCYQGRVSRDFLPAKSGYVRLTFSVPRTAAHYSIRTDTWVAIGIAINWIDIRPVSQSLSDKALESVLKSARRPRTLRQFLHGLPFVGAWLRSLYLRLRAVYYNLN